MSMKVVPGKKKQTTTLSAEESVQKHTGNSVLDDLLWKKSGSFNEEQKVSFIEEQKVSFKPTTVVINATMAVVVD